MSLQFENNEPYAQMNTAAGDPAFSTLKPASFGSTVTITGNTTVSGTLAVTGAITGPRTTNVVTTALVGVTVTVPASASGTTYLQAATSGTPSFTLPAAVLGLEYTFITKSTSAGYTITCADSAVIHCKTSATGTAITSTTTITNTQGTAVVGDALALICDGTNWYAKAQTGIFAAS